MKRILIIILIGFTTLSVSAQRKKAEAGSKAGNYKGKGRHTSIPNSYSYLCFSAFVKNNCED